jgi:hypothetical protein
MRANARLLYSVEFAVPRALDAVAQNALVERFIRLVTRRSVGPGRAGALPAVAAFHEGRIAGEDRSGREPNPHVHLKLATSINDGVQRSREQWFRRANPKHPDQGGAARSSYLGSRRWLLELRKLWARLANRALRRAGLEATLDHRSYRDRGLALQPTRHLGPRETASLRAGRPGPRARRNERIRRLNAELADLERRRKQAAEEEAAATRAEEARLFVLRDQLKRARRNLHRALDGSPMAGRATDLLEASTLLLLTNDVAGTGKAQTDRSLDEVRPRLRATLGDAWIDVRVRARVFLLRPDRDDVIVVGHGWLATDSVEPGIGHLLAGLARSMGLQGLVGHAKAEQLPLRDEVDAASAQGNLPCVWRERRAVSRAAVLPR